MEKRGGKSAKRNNGIFSLNVEADGLKLVWPGLNVRISNLFQLMGSKRQNRTCLIRKISTAVVGRKFAPYWWDTGRVLTDLDCTRFICGCLFTPSLKSSSFNTCATEWYRFIFAFSKHHFLLQVWSLIYLMFCLLFPILILVCFAMIRYGDEVLYNFVCN